LTLSRYLSGQPDPTPFAFDGKFGSLTLKRMALMPVLAGIRILA
jgi:hypothetical protein